MQPEIKLVISHNDKIIHSVKKELNEQGFVKSIEDFQIVANATMTQLIEDSGDSGDCIMEDDSDDSDVEEEIDSLSPKKKKK